MHLVCDSRGIPLAVQVTGGQINECLRFESVLSAVRFPQKRGRPRRRPRAVAGDKGYSVGRIRRWLQRRHIRAIIPQRRDQEGRWDGCRTFDKKTYRRRNVVERCVAWMKESRRLATRYEKLAVSFLAMLDLWMVQRYLRVLFPDGP